MVALICLQQEFAPWQKYHTLFLPQILYPCSFRSKNESSVWGSSHPNAMNKYAVANCNAQFRYLAPQKSTIPNCPSASNWNISDRKAVFLQPYRFVLFFPISICFRFHVRNVCLQYEWRSELRKNFFLKIYFHRFHFFRQLASDWLTNKAPVHKASHDFYLMTECPWDVRSISKQQILSADGHGVRVTWHRFSTVQKRGERAFFGNCA